MKIKSKCLIIVTDTMRMHNFYYIQIIKTRIDSIILGVRVNSWDARTQLEFWDSEKRLEIEADNLSAVTDLKT